MPPEVVSLQAVRVYIIQARDLVRALPDKRQLNEVAVTEGHVNSAKELLDAPQDRLREELLAHKPETFATPTLERLRGALGVPAPADEGGSQHLPLRHLKLLRAWMEWLLERHVGSGDAAELSQPVEFAPIPPCGAGGK